MQYKTVSVLEAQRQLFPKYIDAFSFQERYCNMLLSDYKGQVVSDNLQSLINGCEAKSYKEPAKDVKIHLQDYHFNAVLKNYETMKYGEGA